MMKKILFLAGMISLASNHISAQPPPVPCGLYVDCLDAYKMLVIEHDKTVCNGGCFKACHYAMDACGRDAKETSNAKLKAFLTKLVNSAQHIQDMCDFICNNQTPAPGKLSPGGPIKKK